MPELAIFDPPEVQTAVEKGVWVDVFPANLNLNAGKIEFEIVANDEYIDLNDTILTVNASVVKATDGGALAQTDDVAFINAPLYSMFSDVLVYLNGERVDGGDQVYPYKAMISMLFAYSNNALSQQMLSAGYIKDTAGEMDSPEKNAGRKARGKWNVGRTYIGRLLIDTFQQSRYLLNGVGVRIVLDRAAPEFALHAAGQTTTKAKFQINSVKLSVRRVRVAEAIARIHEQTLTRTNALYPFPKKAISTYNLLAGSRGFVKENLYNGKIPKLLIVAMVAADAYNGSYTKNPYNFIHEKVLHVSVKKDGENIPGQPYEPDFENGSWMREYTSIYANCSLMGRDENLSFTHDEYASGYTFFVFNLTPDLSMTNALLLNSNIRLEVRFSAALTQTITLLVFGVFDGLFEIDKDRNVYVLH